MRCHHNIGAGKTSQRILNNYDCYDKDSTGKAANWKPRDDSKQPMRMRGRTMEITEMKVVHSGTHRSGFPRTRGKSLGVLIKKKGKKMLQVVAAFSKINQSQKLRGCQVGVQRTAHTGQCLM